MQALEPKTQAEQKDMEDAIGSVEYLFALGLTPKDELVGHLQPGNRSETMVKETVRFVNGWLDETKDTPVVIHYHGAGYFDRVVPFFSQSDIAFAVSKSIPPSQFILHVQNSPTIWVISPYNNLKPHEKPRYIHENSVPVVNNPDNQEQLSAIATFLAQHNHTLHKSSLKGFNSKLELIR